ncbi:MAG TPA: phosphopantetheine-binding protein [Thermoanaerobaculia bacterium]|nr:phosphopantetheine-binding protein [Thermoanaerobaculia bacterium]
MDDQEITTRIREVVAKITSIPIDRIGEDVDFRDDLGIDSLSMLEIGVDVDFEFGLHVEDLDQLLPKIRTLADAVAVVREKLGTQNSTRQET